MLLAQPDQHLLLELTATSRPLPQLRVGPGPHYLGQTSRGRKKKGLVHSSPLPPSCCCFWTVRGLISCFRFIDRAIICNLKCMTLLFRIGSERLRTVRKVPGWKFTRRISLILVISFRFVYALPYIFYPADMDASICLPWKNETGA